MQHWRGSVDLELLLKEYTEWERSALYRKEKQKK